MESIFLNILLVVIAVSGILVLGILTIFLVSMAVDCIRSLREEREHEREKWIQDYMTVAERVRKELDARQEVVDRH